MEESENKKEKFSVLEAKKFITEILKNPIEKINEVANDNSLKYFKISVILLIIWSVENLINSTYSNWYYYGFTRVFTNILAVLKVTLSPIIGVLTYSIIVLILNKEKKQLTTIISTVIITKIPVIIADLVCLLTLLNAEISRIVLPFATFCSSISIVLGFFGFKHLFNKECKEFIKTYVLIQGIYYICYMIILLLGMYI